MKLTLETIGGKEVYAMQCSFVERETPRAAGFNWSPTRKLWYTDHFKTAARFIHLADEPTRTKLQAILAEQKNAIEGSKATNSSLQIPVPANCEYLPYQKGGIQYASKRPFTLIADEPGLGKTVQALGVANLNNHRSILIICPASLKSNWEREAIKWLTDKSLTVGAANGSYPTADVIIINYDILKKYRTELRAKTWDLLICDESHYLKNFKAQRTAEVVGGGKDKIAPITAKQTLFLTGTPILNRPEELWTTVRFAGLFTNWFRYVTTYCEGKQTGWGWDTSGASNLPQLNDILREKIMVRRLKQDVLTDLPAKRRRTIFLEKSKSVTKILEKAEAEAAKFGFTIGADVDCDYEPLFDKMALIRKQISLEKVPFACSYIQEVLDSGVEALIVFTHHREALDQIQAYLEKNSISIARIDGGVKPELRQAQVDLFQSGKARVFLGTIKAAGVGLTLTAASHTVFVEQSWTPADLKQAEDRIHRIGQKNAVQIDYLVYRDSIDEYILQTVIAKAEVESAALDGDGEMVELPSKEEIEKLAKETADNRQQLLETKKGLELKKNYWNAFLQGARTKAVVSINNSLSEIVRLEDGWMVDGMYTSRLPEFDRLWHQGRCSCCGRTLTDSDSIARGIGPVCAGLA
jgi:SWI/SNF-related matrix-associated actin-dependent regulator 1 of chromatin subfamily A